MILQSALGVFIHIPFHSPLGESGEGWDPFRSFKSGDGGGDLTVHRPRGTVTAYGAL